MINRKDAAKEFMEKMDEVKPMTFDEQIEKLAEELLSDITGALSTNEFNLYVAGANAAREILQGEQIDMAKTVNLYANEREKLEEKLRICVVALRRYANAEMGTSIAKQALKEIKGGSDE